MAAPDKQEYRNGNRILALLTEQDYQRLEPHLRFEQEIAKHPASL